MIPLKVNDAFVAKARLPPLNFHWYFNGAVPVAAMLRVTVLPATTILFVNGLRSDGLLVPGGRMVTVKVRVTMLLLAPPSLTVTVMVPDPAALATGVKVNVPLVFGLV